MESRKIIAINLIFILIMAFSGIYFGVSANSQALLTDGVVSLVIFFSSSLGILIHSILNHSNDYLYPFGKWRFEYVYNFIRLMIITIIIVYSLFESIISITAFFRGTSHSNIINLSQISLYFPIKLGAAFISLTWLRSNKSKLDEEYYQVERDSVLVDGLLTISILIGFSLLGRISSVAEIADSITLLIISVILLITIFEELKHLVFVLIGKRIYIDLEQQLSRSVNYADFKISDIHIEKFGIVYIVFVTCSYPGSKPISTLEEFEANIGSNLEQLGISKYRIELNFRT